ncbi:MAG: glycoside hydrolase family 99-like domain-containing protein, partial [Chloroflexi bacterium]|nr:glycoside hydrolase family 99-like domain-containing protein [Chloroflexota bacterium]
ALRRVPTNGQPPLETWRWIRDQVDPGRSAFWLGEGDDLSYLDVFDSIYFFDISWAADPAYAMASLNRKWTEYNRQHGTNKALTATVMPGYDDSRLGRASPHVRPRNDGQYYTASFQAAINLTPSLIVINSYNEWFEGTQIEPSVSYGSKYLDLTREWSARYKAR